MGFINQILGRTEPPPKEIAEEGPYFHNLSIGQVADILETDTENGLTVEQVVSRQQQNGLNKLDMKFRTPVWRLVAKHVIQTYTLLMLILSGLSIYYEDYIGLTIYILLMLMNSGMGFFQDYYSQMSADCLDEFCSSTKVKVIRGGVASLVNSDELVCGDLVVLKAGDVIGADGRLVKSTDLSVDEAHLTGESISVLKDEGKVFDESTPVGDRLNMVLGGSHITQGTGHALVCLTGMSTQMGRITRSLNQSQSGSTGIVQRSMRVICFLILIMFIPVWILWMFVYSKMPHVIQVNFIVGLAIAISPKILEPVTTLTSFLGIKKMAKIGAVIRRNDVLETMGLVTDLCSDKTGTITLAKMVVTKLWVPSSSNSGGVYEVSGDGYSPVGEITQSDNTFSQSDPNFWNISNVIKISKLCNNATINQNNVSGDWEKVGEPTEAALTAFSHKLPQTNLNWDDFELLYEFPFDPILKIMSVVVRDKSSGSTFLYTKGAPEMILSRCNQYMVNGIPISANDNPKRNLTNITAEILGSFMSLGLRNLCFAIKELTEFSIESIKPTDRETMEINLTLVGLVGIYDPPRPDVKQSIQNLHKAHITVRMITGDHLGTAKTIAKQVGIISDQPELINEKHMIMEGSQFDSMSDEELDSLPNLPLVVARCTPHTKVRLVHALQRRNKTVAMTGDGVNDSPSLKLANVGIAMGKNGSQVTQQAANIILSDDHFSAIVPIVAEGRRVLTNIINICRFLITINVANLALVLLELMFKDSEGYETMHVTSYQIIFLHMICIPPAAIALGFQQNGKHTMHRPPRESTYGVFTMEVVLSIVFDGLSISGLIALTYGIMLKMLVTDEGPGSYYCGFKVGIDNCEPTLRARTAKFLSFIALSLLHSIHCRTTRASAYSPTQLKSLFNPNPYQQPLLYSIAFGFLIYVPFVYTSSLNSRYFSSLPITWEWVAVPINCLAFVIITEAYKFFKSVFFGRSRRE